MSKDKRGLFGLIFPYFINFSTGLSSPLSSSFFSDYYKIFQNPIYQNQIGLRNKGNNNFLPRRNQDRANVNRLTRRANVDYAVRDHAYERQDHDKRLKGGFYCSYFTDIHNQEARNRKNDISGEKSRRTF